MMKLPYKARVTMEYQAQYPDPIQVAAGEKIRVGNENRESPGWKWCRASDGRAGWVPVELISAGAAKKNP